MRWGNNVRAIPDKNVCVCVSDGRRDLIHISISTQYVRHTGMWMHVLKNRWHFLVGAQAIRYRHAIPPYRAIEVHSQVIYWDESWIYIRSRFIDPATSILYAEGLRRFALRKGKDTVSPSNLITLVTSVRYHARHHTCNLTSVRF
jgi:hypothetical protein